MSLRSDLDDVEDAAVERITAQAREVVEAMVDEDGLTYGDRKFEGEVDEMLYLQDLGDRGVMEMLYVVAPKLAAKYEQRYARLLAKRVM